MMPSSLQLNVFARGGGLALALLPAAMEAQEVGAPMDLGEISVLGTGLETTVFESPSSVAVVGPEAISKIPPARAVDFLARVPGVRIDDASGINRIQIRGEEARRVRILIDGIPVTDHTDFGPPVVVDPSTIERIEVVRGASSVISGQRAIGGTVNIVTKRGGDRPIEGETTASLFSATDGFRLSQSLAGRQGGFSWRLNFGKSELDNLRAAGEGELDPSDSNDRNLSFYLGYETGPHEFSLRGTAFDLDSSVYTGIPDFDLSLPKRDLRRLAFTYEGTDLTPWMPSLTFDLYTETIEREFRTTIGPMPLVESASDDKQRTSGASLEAELRFVEGLRSFVGIEYEDDFIDADALSRTTLPFPPGFVVETNRKDEARIRTTSLFNQNEWTISPELTAHFGLRYYRIDAKVEHSNTNPKSKNEDERLVGSAGLVWTPMPELALRASVSSGYNYPTLKQLFMEAPVRVGGVSGLRLPNPDLDPETSVNYELGARYDNGNTMLDATLFYTDADDYILRQQVQEAPRRYQFVNVAGAKTWGLELYAETLLPWGFTPYLSAALIKRKLDFGGGYETWESGTPALSGTLGLRSDIELFGRDGSIDMFLIGETRADLRDATGARDDAADPWATFNMRGSLALSERADLLVSVNNLFDQDYQAMGRLPGAERSIDLSMRFRF